MYDSGLETHIDLDGFKKIAPASQTSRVQREGRIARVSDGIHHAHGVAPDTDLESPFYLPLDAALQALAASLCLRDPRCPLIGVAGLWRQRIEAELIRLALAMQTTGDQLLVTPFGERCLNQSFDVRVCAFLGAADVFHVSYHARVAVAYLEAGMDLPTNVNDGAVPHLTSSQMEMARGNGWDESPSDLHTVVDVFLRWVAARWETPLGVNEKCLNKNVSLS